MTLKSAETRLSPSAEADHRIKNNLAMVAGMLGAQAREARDPALVSGLNQARARIMAVASLHHVLTDRAPTERVDLGSYLAAVCDRLEDADILPRRIRFERELEGGIGVPNEAATRIGLVLAELVSNAGEHAFPDHRSGTVRVSLWRDLDAIRLYVDDDGTGIEAATVPGSGSMILSTLVSKLGGDLVRQSGKLGCKNELVFLPTT